MVVSEIKKKKQLSKGQVVEGESIEGVEGDQKS